MLPILYSVFPKEYKRFIEVFGGSGAVLLGHDPVDFEVYNDVDGELVNCFRVIRNRPAEFLLDLGIQRSWSVDIEVMLIKSVPPEYYEVLPEPAG